MSVLCFRKDKSNCGCLLRMLGPQVLNEKKFRVVNWALSVLGIILYQYRTARGRGDYFTGCVM